MRLNLLLSLLLLGVISCDLSGEKKIDSLVLSKNGELYGMFCLYSNTDNEVPFQSFYFINKCFEGFLLDKNQFARTRQKFHNVRVDEQDLDRVITYYDSILSQDGIQLVSLRGSNSCVFLQVSHEDRLVFHLPYNAEYYQITDVEIFRDVLREFKHHMLFKGEGN